VSATPVADAEHTDIERTDKELLAAHAAGDKHAFTELIRRHYDHLWYVALRTSASREDAADCLQEALLAAHRNAGNFRGEAAVRTWLHTITVNSCLDRIRRNKVRPTVPISGDDGTEIEPTDSHNRIAEFETSHVVERALAELPPDQRAALVAVDVEGFSVAETAKMLGVAEGTVKSRCARARAKLADRLEFLRDPGNRM
jgi:RNA polymerase sigma-70 factor (ECF subfamily)